MNADEIRSSIDAARALLAANPDKRRRTDAPATAVLEAGLRCRARGPEGAEIVSDMPRGVGGEAGAPRPGWYLRASLATCDATVIAMRAAELGITLDLLEVTVESESDGRGLLGMDDAVPAGPLAMRMKVRIAAAGVDAARLRDIVHWADAHSPVGDAIRRAIDVELQIES
jgi:uncharacterized OsmC-like protein